MNRIRYFRMLAVFLLAALMLAACSSTDFDPENQQEYGAGGVYLGQNIKEAIGVLKPAKADFMDMVSRQTYTIDQMAAGEGEAVMGMLLVDHSQLIVKVKNGLIQSIMLGAVAQEDAQKFKTIRGFGIYDSADQLQKLYGKGTGEKEVVYQGSKYQASFGLADQKVAWMRFDMR